MPEFAVSVKEVTKEGQATWVLAVDPVGERLLIAHEDRTMHWHPIVDCVFAKLVPPDMPVPVFAAQPPQAQLTLPVLANRAERRSMEHNGR